MVWVAMGDMMIRWSVTGRVKVLKWIFDLCCPLITSVGGLKQPDVYRETVSRRNGGQAPRGIIIPMKPVTSSGISVLVVSATEKRTVDNLTLQDWSPGKRARHAGSSANWEVGRAAAQNPAARGTTH